MERLNVQTRYPDAMASHTIGLLRWVLMALIVVIHTDLVDSHGGLFPKNANADSKRGLFLTFFGTPFSSCSTGWSDWCCLLYWVKFLHCKR